MFVYPIGKWKWIYSENFWAPNEGRNTENENTVIEFFNDYYNDMVID